MCDNGIDGDIGKDSDVGDDHSNDNIVNVSDSDVGSDSDGGITMLVMVTLEMIVMDVYA